MSAAFVVALAIWAVCLVAATYFGFKSGPSHSVTVGVLLAVAIGVMVLALVGGVVSWISDQSDLVPSHLHPNYEEARPCVASGQIIDKSRVVSRQAALLPVFWFVEIIVAAILFGAGKYWFLFRDRPLLGLMLIAVGFVLCAHACPMLISWWTRPRGNRG